MSDIAQPVRLDPISSDRGRMRRRAVIAFGALLAVAALAVAGILSHATNEQQRLRDDWTVRLGIVADSRTAAIEGWLQQRRAEMLRLSSHRALQFYLVDRADPEVPAVAIDSRLPYVEELLTGEALRGAYMVVDPNSGDIMPGRGGIMLLDADQNPIARTQDSPGLAAAGLGRLTDQAVTTRAFRSPEGLPMIALTQPVRPPLGSSGAPLGYLVGFRVLDEGLFALLRQPGDADGQSMSWLTQPSDAGAQRINAGSDGQYLTEAHDPLTRTLTNRSGGDAALTGPDGAELLAVSRAVGDLGWTLIRATRSDTALAEGERRIWLLSGVLLLAVLLAGVCVIAVWRHAISDRLASAASDLSRALGESDRLSRLLQRLTDAVPNGIIAVGPDEEVLFGNRAAFQGSGIDAREAEGKDLVGIFGPGRAGPLLTANARVRTGHETVKELDDREDPKGRQVVLRSHVPLDGESVLMIAEDMTEIVVEREQRAKQLDSLVNVLVDLIDARDSYAAHHSRRVADLSRAMAEQMNLPDSDALAAETAARLMNLGKLSIEPSLLTRSGDLSPEELALIRGSILRSADLVAGVNFDGPVVETLRQLQARFDGKGNPEDIAGDSFLATAQIVSVANAYIALISDRAHRKALPVSDAHEQIWGQAGTVWGRPVVAALVQATAA